MLNNKLSLIVTAILLFYLLYRIKTTVDKFSTIRLKLSSTLLKTLNFRLRSKKGLKLTLLIGLSFKEVSI